MSEHLALTNPEAEATLETKAALSRVAIGALVTVLIDDDPDTEQYYIAAKHVTGAPHIVSIESPLGRALLGAAEGDTVTFMAPRGMSSAIVHKIERGTPE